MTEDEFHVFWCVQLFESLNLGGTWIVPAAQFIFSKESLDPPTLKLIFPDELSDEQRDEFDLFAKKFAAAGIELV